MEQVELWPPPKWPEVVIKWNTILSDKTYNVREMLAWIDHAPGGRYHLHGYKSTEGFAFRFEREEDATMFSLRWAL
jgi:hypothetical protein